MILFKNDGPFQMVQSQLQSAICKGFIILSFLLPQFLHADFVLTENEWDSSANPCNDPPVADVAVLPDLTADCELFVTSFPTATDSCSGLIIGTTSDTLHYDVQGTHVITWMYVDGLGNVIYQPQNVIIQDAIAPVPDIAVLDTVFGNCSGITRLKDLPIATDNCAGIVAGSTSSAVNFTSIGTYTVIWSFDDNNGNISTQDQIVVIEDNDFPVADTLTLAVVSGYCSVTVLTVPTATDTCTGNLLGSTTDSLFYDEPGSYIVTWEYDDGSGNITYQTQTVNVLDSLPPVADVMQLPVVVGNCDVVITDIPTATDDCSGAIVGTTTDSLNYDEQGTYMITWTYTDENGNSSVQLQPVIIADSIAPVPNSVLDTLYGECDLTIDSIPTATDDCAGLINANTSDSLTCVGPGVHTITWLYEDGNGNSSSQIQTIIITDTLAPVALVDSLDEITAECTYTIEEFPLAFDECEDTIVGTTNDNLLYDALGVYQLEWIYDDGNGNVSTQWQTINIIDTTAPVPDLDTLAELTAECELTVVEEPTAMDNCEGLIIGTTEDSLYYSEQGTYSVLWTYDDGNGNSTTQVQIIIIDDITPPVPDVDSLEVLTAECDIVVDSIPTATDNCEGLILGTTLDSLSYDEQGVFTITWSYDDGNGNISTQDQTVIIDDITAPVPNVDSLPVLVGQCEVVVDSIPDATDNCEGLIIGTTANNLTYTEQGTFTITWVYDDGNGNSSFQYQTVIVDDTIAPIPDLDSLPVLTAECDLTVSDAPTATDNCEGLIVGTTTDSLVFTEQGEHTITWTYDDGNGNISTQEQTIIIDDITAPVPDIANLPDVVAECSVTINTVPTATDNCEGTIVGTTDSDLTFDSLGTYTVNWMYDDGNGNISYQDQQVIVQDLTAPVYSIDTVILELSTNSISLTIIPTAIDNCEGLVNGTTSDVLVFTIQGVYTITWSFTDSSGNTSTGIQVVVVNDINAPTPDVDPLPVLYGTYSVTVTVIPTATDNVSGTVIGTTTDPLYYDQQGTYTITWTYDDGSGNVYTQFQQVIVNDYLAPDPDVDTLSVLTDPCSVTVDSFPTATFNLSLTATATVTGTTTNPLFYDVQGTYSITWNYDDGNGNFSTQLQTIIIADTMAPVAVIDTLYIDLANFSVTVSTPPTALDDCEGSITGTTSDPLTFNGQGTYSINWSFDDGNGNISIYTQIIIIIDIGDPVPDVDTLPDLNGELEVIVDSVPTASDNNDGIIIGTTDDPLVYTEQGVYIIVWIFTDSTGNTTSQNQTVTVDDETSPVSDTDTLDDLSGDYTVVVDSVPTATDNYSGVVIGTTNDPLIYTEQGVYIITWTFTDDNGNTSTQTQTVIVNDNEAPEPVIDTLPVLTGDCSVSVVDIPTATFNLTATLTGTVVATTTDPLYYDVQGTYTITWNYDDGNGNTSIQFQTVVVADITAPVPDAAILIDLTAEVSLTVTIYPTATDVCGGTVVGTTSDPLVYTTQGTFTITWVFTDSNGNSFNQIQIVIINDVTPPVPNVTPLPDLVGQCGLIISIAPIATDNCVGAVAATTVDLLTFFIQGTFTITWTYDDGNGNSVTQVQNVIISDNIAPVADLVNLPDVVGECSAEVDSVPTATDNCSGSLQGTTMDPLIYATQGTYTVTWTYDDGHGNTTTQLQTVIVDDLSSAIPVVDSLPDLMGECEVIVDSIPTAMDDCEGVIAGVTTDSLLYTEPGTYIVTWTYDDGNGNISNQDQNIVVIDTTAPIACIDTLPILVGECDYMVTVIPSSIDNCGDSIFGTTTDSLYYDILGSHFIIWTYDDGYGNFSSQSQEISIIDTTAPLAIVDPLPVVYGQCDAQVMDEPLALDNCMDTIIGTTTDTLYYDSQGIYTVIWTYDDGNGNVSTQQQLVVVMDTVAPVADGVALDMVIGECQVEVTEIPTATDVCFGLIYGTTSDSLIYDSLGVYTITWNFDDGLGNVSYQTQIVQVVDTTAASFICPVDLVTCTDTVSGIGLTNVYDNCGVPSISYTLSGATTASGAGDASAELFNPGITTVEYIVEDGNGNEASQYFDVEFEVVDTSVTLVSTTLTANAVNATYQWMDCDANAIISGEVGATFTPASFGDYSVIVTSNGCVDTSSCYAVDRDKLSMRVYPNPVIDNMIIDFGLNESDVEVIVFNIKGEEVYRRVGIEGVTYKADLSHLSQGMYIMHVGTQYETYTLKLTKE